MAGLVVAAVADQRTLRQLQRFGVFSPAAGNAGEREIAAALPGRGPHRFVESGERFRIASLQLKRGAQLVISLAVVWIRIAPYQ
ncbi:hypothetical protein D3C75_726740 [compost metagenome]